MNAIDNALFLRRRNKIGLPAANGNESLPLHYVASILKNIEALGFTFSEPLIAACRRLSLEQLTVLYQELISDLRRAKGAHQTYAPMYPNFPAQVMAAAESELYINAILHYLTGGRLFPYTKTQERLPLLDNADTVKMQVIDLGSEAELAGLFRQIAASNASLSEQDKADLTWFVETYQSDIVDLLPDAIPQKENMAFVASLLLKHNASANTFLSRFCRTATDILRLAAAMSEGDVSLATATRFRSFTRAERNLLLSLLERCPNATEDMLRWKPRWIRLGERLHPGEYARKYPHAAEAFQVLRNDLPFATFNNQIEQALTSRNVEEAVRYLRERPGDFARRLDHLLRLDTASQEAVLLAFSEVAVRVSTPVLLQTWHYFAARSHPERLRVFFPKGNVAKAFVIPNQLPELAHRVCVRVMNVCAMTLIERFHALPPLGRVYVDEALQDYPVPFAARSASRSFRTLTRGSKVPLPADCTTLRFFVWWKNGKSRTDIDLSAAMFDAAFNYTTVVAYYNLKELGGCHSGDIVDAPQGASEFIDITLDTVRAKGGRYVAMILNSFTHQPYCDLPECFAGWMARNVPESGEIYEPKTVQDRLDITANTRIAIPLVIDIVERKVIWCDMALQRNPRWVNNVETNLNGINLTLQSLTALQKPTLRDLFTLHARARGEQVPDAASADIVFSVENGTPFQQEMIASEYMA